MAKTVRTAPAAETTTASQETAVEQTAQTMTPEQLKALYESMTPEQRALIAVAAKHDETTKDVVKATLKAVRKQTRLAKRAAKRAAKCDPNSPLYNPETAKRIATREANKALREAGGVEGVRINAAKADKVKELAIAAGISEDKIPGLLKKVAKAGMRAMLAQDGVSINGWRGTVIVRNEDGSQDKKVKTMTLATHKDLSLDAMKAETETYVRTVLVGLAA